MVPEEGGSAVDVVPEEDETARATDGGGMVVPGFCNRTAGVQRAILNAVGGVACDTVTEQQLAALTGTLQLSSAIPTLKSGDFAGLGSLTELQAGRIGLTEIKPGAFAGLSAWAL